ncbi:MAG: ferrochelatase [Pirellulaceae bacterium]|nr:ferrochelatase [Pirellulaceae bacterium]
MAEPQFDSLLLVSFGGPEGRDDVMPFLENVLRGKNVPRERMLEVAEHYYHFDGVSPINKQNRALMAALEIELKARGVELPLYWGNRNWHPMLPDTLRQMAAKGHRRALAFFTSIFSSYSGCRQYRENIAAAQAEVGPDAPQVQKVRMGFNHPEFISAQSDLLQTAMASLSDPKAATVLFTAHSIPMGMADNCRYVEQLNASAALIAESVGAPSWELVFQSRSGPPTQPWLEPDVCDRIAELKQQGLKALAIVPLGFISDHMEVLYDLDTEAADLCQKLGIECVRVPTVGVHPAFVRMIVDLIEERLYERSERPYLGSYGPSHDVCPANCCLYTPAARPPAARPTP